MGVIYEIVETEAVVLMLRDDLVLPGCCWPRGECQFFSSAGAVLGGELVGASFSMRKAGTQEGSARVRQLQHALGCTAAHARYLANERRAA